MLDKMPLDRGASLIIERLYSSGYEANIVGGAVRNHILGIPVSDIDITTSALPEEVCRIFSDLRVIETGIKHGTVTVLVDGTPYELTTYRTDGSYLDNRHPESVSFTASLSEDLARRDFTVNAIAYNPRDGYTDLFGGISDIKDRVIRAVGNPEVRFGEDALRILRAIRFASALGFSVEAHTALAVRKCAPLLANVSRERIFLEWTKLLLGSGAHAVLSFYSDVISTVVGELSKLRLPEPRLFNLATPTVRELSLFYLSCPDPVSSFNSAMTALRADNRRRKNGISALEIIDGCNLRSRSELRLFVYRYSLDSVATAVELAYTVGKINAEEYANAKSAFNGANIHSLADLSVGGADIMPLGLSGREIGSLLDTLAVAVIEERCENTRDSLICYAKKIINAG
ncbi:MAG: CCA tRNA nucleotidyltransferase [Clostridia bacterium]|nr:CCA tRNA nucleotidyltransferase [Clostridia bacterium]